MKKLKEKKLLIYIILNILYVFIGSYLFFTKKIESVIYADGLIIIAAFNLILSTILVLKKKYIRNKIDIFMVLILIFAMISTLFAYKQDVAIYGEKYRYEGLYTLIYYMTMVFLTSYLKKEDKKIVVHVILLTGIVHTLYATCQRLDLLGVRTVIHRGQRYISGLTTNPNFYGTYMVLCLSYSLGLYIDTNKLKCKIIYLIFAFVFTIGLLMSNCLSCVIGLFPVFIYILVYCIKNKMFKKSLCMFIILISSSTLICLLGGTKIINDINIFRKQTSDLVSGNKFDTLNYGTGRLYVWKKALSKAPDYFLHGIGVDNFMYVMDGKPITRTIYVYDKAHNEYLQTFVTQGIFSLISYLIFYFLIVFRGIKSSFKNKEVYLILPIIGYLSQAFFNISVIEVAPIFCIALGLCIDRYKGKEEKV